MYKFYHATLCKSSYSLVGVVYYYVRTLAGGTVVKPERFGRAGYTHTLVHELGHNLGLWHVHHGVTESSDCADQCYEHHPSLKVGDLCDDTNPTPQNTECHNPSSRDLIYYKGRYGTQDLMTCGKTEYRNTPYDNYMSYAGMVKQYWE